jgi:hypothetical protein
MTTFQLLNDGQHPRKTAPASKPSTQHPLLTTIVLCAVLLASLVAGTTAVPVQPTFDVTGAALVNVSGTYVVDGLSVYSNGTRIFPDMSKVYTLNINAHGTVALTVQGGIYLNVTATRATTFNATVATGAIISILLETVTNVGVEITVGSTVRWIHSPTSESLQSLAVNANSSFIGSPDQDFLFLNYTPSCMTTLNLVNTSNSLNAAPIRSLLSSGGLGGLTITIAESSLLTFGYFLAECSSCNNVQLSILNCSAVAISTPIFSSSGYAFLEASSSASVTVEVDNSTVCGRSSFIEAYNISGPVTATIRNNATVSAYEFLSVVTTTGVVSAVVDNATIQCATSAVIAVRVAFVVVTVRGSTIGGYLGYVLNSVVSARACTTATVNISDSTVVAATANNLLDVVTTATTILRSAVTTYYDPCKVDFTLSNASAVVTFAATSSNFTGYTESSLLVISNVAAFPTSPNSSVLIQGNKFDGAWSSLLRTVTNYSIASEQYLTTTITSNVIDYRGIVTASFAFVSGWPLQGLVISQNSARVIARTITLADTAVMKNFSTAVTKLLVVGNNVTVGSAGIPALQAAGSGCTTVSGDSDAMAICWNTIVATPTEAATVVLVSSVFGNHAASLLADNTVNFNCGSQCNPITVVFFQNMTFSTRISVFRNVMNIGAGSAVANWALFDNLNTTVAITVVGSALMSFPTTALSSTLCNSYSSSTPTTVLCANAVNMQAAASMTSGAVIRNSAVGAMTASLVFDLQAAPTNQVSSSIGQFDFFSLSNATSFTLSVLALSSQVSATLRILRSSIVMGAVSASSLSATFTDTSSAGVTFGFAFIEDLKYSTALTMSSLSISMNTLKGTATAAICLKCFVKDNVAVTSNTITITNSPVAVAAIAGIVFGTLPQYDSVATASAKTGVVRGNLLIVAPTGINPS